MPRVFKRGHAAQADERQPFELELPGHRQEHRDQQHRQSKHRRRIRQRQPPDHHHEKGERQHNGERRNLLRQVVAQVRCLIGAGLLCGQSAPQPRAGRQEEKRTDTHNEQQRWQSGEFGRDLEQHARGGNPRKPQYRQHRHG